MEREIPRQQPSGPGDSGARGSPADGLERSRARLNDLSDAMDRALAGIDIDPALAEQMLQQNRQTGGQ